MELKLGHTPDADDAFMFYGINSGKIQTPHFTITQIIEDIESLNRRMLKHELDVTAISAHAYAYSKNYVVLHTGASFGIKYGPIVISKNRLSLQDLRKCTIAIPGKMTSANLLLNLVLGRFKSEEIPFHQIPDAVLSNRVEAGLIIHESQITYRDSQLFNILDLGLWWDKITNGLPVPLGINVASKEALTSDQITQFDSLFKKSILYGLDNIDAAVEYAMRYGRGHPKQVISKFIKMYVNNLTIDMGESGVKALKKIFTMAEEKGILSNVVLNFY
jgi:1,4-dihydroxy-6-naphthoate synthase